MRGIPTGAPTAPGVRVGSDAGAFRCVRKPLAQDEGFAEGFEREAPVRPSRRDGLADEGPTLDIDASDPCGVGHKLGEELRGPGVQGSTIHRGELFLDLHLDLRPAPRRMVLRGHKRLLERRRRFTRGEAAERDSRRQTQVSDGGKPILGFHEVPGQGARDRRRILLVDLFNPRGDRGVRRRTCGGAQAIVGHVTEEHVPEGVTLHPSAVGQRQDPGPFYQGGGAREVFANVFEGSLVEWGRHMVDRRREHPLGDAGRMDDPLPVARETVDVAVDEPCKTRRSRQVRDLMRDGKNEALRTDGDQALLRPMLDHRSHEEWISAAARMKVAGQFGRRRATGDADQVFADLILRQRRQRHLRGEAVHGERIAKRAGRPGRGCAVRWTQGD